MAPAVLFKHVPLEPVEVAGDRADRAEHPALGDEGLPPA